MANVVLTDEVKDVLRRSTVSGNSLTLPGQLDRKLYETVNKVIVFAGGKWNKSAKAHVFPGDPMTKLGMTLDTGVAVDEKKQRQAYYTPKELADYVAELACIDGNIVLEPSAGDGALADACMRNGAESVVCAEIDPDEAKKLVAKDYTTYQVDFLTTSPGKIGRFSRIVMNPPFQKNQDIKHVAHALKCLEPGGILVAIMAGNTSRPAFVKLVHGLDHDVQQVEAGAFKESGTNVATIILKVRG